MEESIMKKQKTKKRQLMFSLMLIGCLCLSVFVLSCTALMAENKVNVAYELRMNGHADSALVMLDEIILANPDHAVAYYERARAKKHIMGATKAKPDMTGIISDAARACELDPDNLIYAYFCANAKFLAVYIDLMMGIEDVEVKLDEALLEFERTLELQDCFASSLITLTEVNAMLGGEYGADFAKAEYYAELLEKCNPDEGLRARALLLPDEASLLEYWLETYESHEACAVASEELGRAYLLEGDLENGKKYIDEAISLDSDNKYLILDLARATMANAMQNADKDLGVQAVAIFQEFLDLNPDAPASLKAYTYRWMAVVSANIIDDQANATKYEEKMDKLDPFCSRAFGAPSMGLFVPPDVLPGFVGYYSRPF